MKATEEAGKLHFSTVNAGHKILVYVLKLIYTVPNFYSEKSINRMVIVHQKKNI